jgi:TP901 family phage tail tape measure protein
LREPILELTRVLPYTANEIARSIYFGADVVGGLIDVGDPMEYISQTGKLAVATMSDLDTTTNLMNATMKAFKADYSEVVNYTDAFAYAFSKADLPISQLATSFGNIAGQARAVGVGLEESLAALVEMRNSGATTATAMTQLASLMTALQKPSKDLKNIMSDVGVNKATIENEGLIASMQKIEAAAQSQGKSWAVLQTLLL